MPRLKLNRWWILILTLSLVFAFAASGSTRAEAMTRKLSDGVPGGGVPDGDPDTPMGKRAQPSASPRTVASGSTGRVVGDGTPVDSVMMWHFRVVMQSLGLWRFGRF